MFGRATIRLGIGPRSSSYCSYRHRASTRWCQWRCYTELHRSSRIPGRPGINGILSCSKSALCTFTFAMCCRPSVCRLSVCRLSVTLVHPTQAVQIFGNISTALGTLAMTFTENFTEIVPGDPPPEQLNTRGVAKYSDFHLRIHLPPREYV